MHCKHQTSLLSTQLPFWTCIVTLVRKKDDEKHCFLELFGFKGRRRQHCNTWEGTWIELRRRSCCCANQPPPRRTRRRARRHPQPAGSPQFSPVLAKAGSPSRQLCNFSSRQLVWRALVAGAARAAGPAQSDRSRFWSRSHPQLWSAHTTEVIFYLYYKAFRSTILLCNTRIAILFGKITYFFGGFGGSQKQYTHYNSSYHK